MPLPALLPLTFAGPISALLPTPPALRPAPFLAPLPLLCSAQCKGLDEVLSRYQEVVPQLHLSGPTSFAPIVRAAMRAVAEAEGAYHILLLLADGQVSPENMKETVAAIVAASKLPLSIVMVGVGDGPWDDMHRFDDELPERVFDNFQVRGVHVTTIRAALI